MEIGPDIKPQIQWTLLILFIALSLVVLVPSLVLLIDCRNKTSKVIPQPPPPPAPIILNQQQSTAHQETLVQLYTQQVAAYEKDVAAYSTFVSTYKDMEKNSPQREAYELVIRDTLMGIMNSFIAALLGFAFVKAGESAFRYYVNIRYARPHPPN